MKKLICLFCFTALLLNCGGSDDDNSSGTNNAKSFRAKIDGVDFIANEDLVYGFGVEENVPNPTLSIGGNAGDESNVRVIEILIESDELLFSGQEINSDSQSSYALANYYYLDGIINAWSESDAVSYNLRITEIDYENRLVSGEFNFIVFDDNTNETYIITDGIFTNIDF
ncbi:hypothetical protein [Psychroserpens sp. S379A]|uniref:hypothetical protein n=1 Tax=Psychroserpens sp. S379A TaxID=3415137 RepID=UPI003C7B2149